tara:strand:+ start:92 stop:820 length:729 start_codon:yes stop_codon:yes gene_type:complete
MEINKIYNESNLDTMSKMEDNFVDMIITSPPYNIGKSRGNTNNPDVNYDTYTDDLDIEDYFEQTKIWIDECLRVSKNYVFWNVGEYAGCKGIAGYIMSKYKDNLKDTFIWIKNNPNPTGRGVVCNGYEYIFCLCSIPDAVGRKYEYNNFGDNMIKNYIIKPVNNGKDNSGHGYAFGDWLPKYFINYFSKKGDLIYDPFMGSGTTAKAAHLLDRNWIGSEISEKYVDIANKRLIKYLTQTKLF